MTTPSEERSDERSRMNHAPSKRSMERATEVVTQYDGDWQIIKERGELSVLIKKALDSLIDECIQIIESEPEMPGEPSEEMMEVFKQDVPKAMRAVCSGTKKSIIKAIRLKLKGSPEGDTNRDSSKTASKGGEDV